MDEDKINERRLKIFEILNLLLFSFFFTRGFVNWISLSCIPFTYNINTSF